MADIRNWAYVLRSRWEWERYGYAAGFPNGAGFTDIDGYTEFGGRRLLIETKHWDGEGSRPPLPLAGQLRAFRSEIAIGERAGTPTTVLVVYGCGVCDDPFAVYDVGAGEWSTWARPDGSWLSKPARRLRLKNRINRAVGLPALIRPDAS